MIISPDRRWRLHVASSFGCKTRRRPVDVVPRGEQGTRDGREETVTGTGAGGGDGMEDEYGDEHEGRDGGENGSGNGSGGKRETAWELTKW